MPNRRAFRQITDSIDAAFAELQAALLEDFEKDVVDKSKTVKSQVVGIIAMGRWFIQRDGDDYAQEYRTTSIARINDYVHDYGYNAVPGPIRIRCLHGEIISRETDW